MVKLANSAKDQSQNQKNTDHLKSNAVALMQIIHLQCLVSHVLTNVDYVRSVKHNGFKKKKKLKKSIFMVIQQQAQLQKQTTANKSTLSFVGQWCQCFAIRVKQN